MGGRRSSVKILNLHTCPVGLFSSLRNPNGGLEKVVYDLHVLLKKFGVDVLTVCSLPDYISKEEGFCPINIWGVENWRKGWGKYKERLLDLIYKFCPDVIVVHGTNKLLRVFNEWQIPVLFIDHQQYCSINLLYHKDFYENIVPKNRKFGGKIFDVSEVSKVFKEEQIKNQKIVNDFAFDGYLVFQYITKELESYSVCENHNGKAITIGLPVNQKQPHKIDLLRKKGLVDDYDLVTMKPDDVRNKFKKYWDDHIAKNQQIIDRTHCNISRELTMRMLNESMLYASTSPTESAGITGFEAFCMGVPVLFWPDRGKHASIMFCPDGQDWAWQFYNDDCGKFIDYVKNNVENRKRIREYVFDVNSPIKVFDNLMKKIENYYKTAKILLPKRKVTLGDYL